MTSPQNPFGGNPFEAPVQAGPPSYAPPLQGAPLPAGGGEVNTLATLSVVFAFVLAPLGALFGHLGLGQIAQSGQRGRERALVGVTLSYVFVTVAVVGVVVWAALGSVTGRVSAAPMSAAPAAAVPPTATTTAPPPPPPPPPPPVLVAPTDLAGLLPSPADVTELTGRDGMSLTLTETELGGFPKKSSFDPPECEGAVSIGSTHVYDPDAVRGYYLTHMDGPTAIFDQSAAAYDSPVAAESALQVMLANWRKCGGTTISWHTHDGVHDTVLEIPADAGNGITTMRFHAHLGPLGTAGVHALAVKANVLVDVTVLPDNDVDDLSNGVAAVAAFILNRIPGPR